MTMASTIKRLLFGSPEFREKLKELNTKRRHLDTRLLPVMQATLDGDPEWFLKIARDNPICSMRIIEQCEEKK
jgi:hypothetical protein